MVQYLMSSGQKTLCGHSYVQFLENTRRIGLPVCLFVGSNGDDPVYRTWTCFSGHLRLPRPHRRYGDSSRVPQAASGPSRSSDVTRADELCPGARGSGSAGSCTPTTASHFQRRCGDRVSKVDASPVAARDAQDAFEAATHAPGVVLARFSALEFVTGLIDPRSRASAWT